ncbi:MAG: hypothetical protein L7U72_12645 [Rubripirellula sp.]|nr:hypothetical protein [Rubripirellula sp.]
MTIALDEFWKTLENLEICDKKTIDAVRASIADKKVTDSEIDAVSAAKYLIKKGYMTRYQAKHVLASKGDRLRQGSYLILSEATEGSLSQWMVAFDTKAKRQGLWIRIAAGEVNPSLLDPDFANRISQIDSLQHFEVAIEGEDCEIFWRRPNGKLLNEYLSQGKVFESNKVFRIGVSLINALEVLQAFGPRAYTIDADSVWVTEDGAALLLINPLNSKVEMGPAKVPHVREYVAPEVALNSAAQSSRSDIFSLGCLLFRIATGNDPYPDYQDEPSSLGSAPKEVAEAVNDPVSGSLLFRILAYAIAQNPDARFANTSDFKKAWEAGKQATREAVVQTLQRDAASRETVTAEQKSTARVADPKENESSKVNASKTDSKKPLSIDDVGHAVGASKSAKKGQTKTSFSKASTRRGVGVTDSPSNERADLASSDSEANDEQMRGVSSTQESMKSLRDEVSLELHSPEKAKSVAEKIAVAGEIEDNTLNAPTLVKKESKSVDRENSNSDIASDLNETPKGNVFPGQGSLETGFHANGDFETGTVSNESSFIEESPKRVSVRRKKKKSKAPLVLGGMSVAVIVLLIGLLVGGSGDEQYKEEPIVRREPPAVIPPVTGQNREGQQEVETTPSKLVGYEVVDDDRLLFVPPYGTDSPTIPLSLLPPGPSVIVSCRINDFANHEVGQSLLKGVKTGLEDLLNLASDRTNFPLEKINRLTVTMFPGDAGWPEVALAVELFEPINEPDLIELLSVDQARTRENQVIYVSEEENADAYFWTVEEGIEAISAFAVGSIEQISEVASLEGSAIPLPRTSQALWSRTSIDSDLVVLLTPNFLFADGRELLTVSAPEFVDPLRRFMQPDINAALVTMKFNADDSVFVETRFAPSGGISEAALLKKVTELFGAFPAWANDFILESVQDASWKLLAIRMPQMMQYLSGNIRFGLSENAVVANAYLPQAAFPQLVFAGLLAMNTSTTDAPLLNPEAIKMLSVDEMLDLEMTVSFDQESLEFALEAIVNAFQEGLPAGNEMPKAVIVGGDLELMGITQNQQVRDFSKANTPLRSVLTDLVLQANPDKSATGPSDLKQSLIWVVTEGEQGKKEIRITTRQAAERDSYQVPREFTSQE